jgi:hypothetical protein
MSFLTRTAHIPFAIMQAMFTLIMIHPRPVLSLHNFTIFHSSKNAGWPLIQNIDAGTPV